MPQVPHGFRRQEAVYGSPEKDTRIENEDIMKDKATISRSLYEASKGLSVPDQAALWAAVLGRAFGGDEPELTGHAKTIFDLACPPKKQKKTDSRKIPFSQSDIYPMEKFVQAFPTWNMKKIDYYWNGADRYSNEGHSYIDWKATVANWARRDELEGKIKFPDEAEKKPVVTW
jgi:hypothetical protein